MARRSASVASSWTTRIARELLATSIALALCAVVALILAVGIASHPLIC